MITAIVGAAFSKKWNTFVLFYAVLFPIGIGIVYWPPIICAWEWFPERKGFVSGLIVSGYGFASFISGFITTAIVNPQNIKPLDTEGDYFPEDIALRVPRMFKICVSIWSFFSLIGIIGISRCPSYVHQEK
jgi:MFS family permease